MPEFKADIRNALAYLTTQVGKAGVHVVNKTAQIEDLAGFDGVILAAGANPVTLPLLGADAPKVQLAVDILNEKAAAVRGNIVVIGGGLIGTETAVHLGLQEGNRVTIVEMLPQIMNGVAVTDLLAYTERIAKTDMRILTSTRLMADTDEGAVVQGPKGEMVLPADTVILAIGFKPCQELYAALQAAGKEAYLVGDAVKAGKIYDAFHTAYRTALKI